MKLTYRDFAMDEYGYLCSAYNSGLRYNAMVSQAQRIVELMLKYVIDRNLMNNSRVMMSHNLRELYDYVEEMGYDLSEIRESVMSLNNYYTHTRYPGRDAFLAKKEDIESAHDHVLNVVSFILRRGL